MKQKDKDHIGTMINQVKNAGYKPTDIWISKDGNMVYVSTDNINRSKYAKKLNLKVII